MASKDLTDENIKATAESLNLWNQTIAICISEETTKEAVQDQIAEGRIFNVTGTPSSVILDVKSGKRIKIS
jgi:protein-disulfide isomerase